MWWQIKEKEEREQGGCEEEEQVSDLILAEAKPNEVWVRFFTNTLRHVFLQGSTISPKVREVYTEIGESCPTKQLVCDAVVVLVAAAC